MATNKKRHGAYFDLEFVHSERLSSSTPTPRSHSTPVPLLHDLDIVLQMAARPSSSRQASCDSYKSNSSQESHSRTPSGDLYKNLAFAKALHLPSSPITATFSTPSGTPVHLPSPLSRGSSSEYSRESVQSPPTTPESSLDYVCHEPEPSYGGADKDVENKVVNLQSHSVMSLWNDLQTHELLLRLADGSPTFHHYEHPPRRILDLGCGEGTWVKFAAMKWNSPDTYIEGLDVEPLWESSCRPWEASDVSSRVSWRLANFLNRLPYEDHTFDFVRAANLGLAVPRDRWVPLLQEIRRVLRVGGRLELIDDEMFFPPVQRASKQSPPYQQGHRVSETEDIGKEKTSGFWELDESKRITDYIENAFGLMLARKYDMLQVHRYIRDVLPHIFGERNVQKYPSHHIVIPNRALEGTRRSAEGFKAPRKISLSQGPGTPRSHTPELRPEPILPSTASQKAVQVLSTGRRPYDRTNSLSHILPPTGKAAKVLAIATASRPYQPPGFIVLPNKFFECRPDVLEMHACRNMHIIISSKVALEAYLRAYKDVLTDCRENLTEAQFKQVFEDAMWRYDRFKRRRLNWPMDYPGLLMRVDDEDSEVPMSRGLFGLGDGRRRAQSTSCTFVPATAAEDSTKVRVIRVFGATKTRELC